MLIPKNTFKESVNSAQILNAIRNSFPENSAYYTQVPEAKYGDMENLRTIGNVILSDETLYNSFISTLVNRIGKVLISSKLYNNPWAMFKMGTMELGETIEEIFADIIEAHDFNEEVAEAEIFKREKPNVLAVFHILNYKKFYKTTISEVQLRQAFVTWNGVTDLISKILEKLYTSANYDEFLTMKYMLACAIIKGQLHSEEIATITKENVSTAVASIKAVSNKLTFLSRDYNFLGVATDTQKTEQYLIVNSEFDATMDVEVLATAFNMDKAEFIGHKVLVDSFGFTDLELARIKKLLGENTDFIDFTEEQKEILENVPCVLLDKEFFRILDSYLDTTSQFNGEGVYWNYWFHNWKTFSTSPFANAVVFSTIKGEIESVTITPKSVELAKGDIFNFTAKVETNGIISTNVTYSIAEDNTTSTITNNGELTIGADEPNATLTINVTSVMDSTKSDTATVIVTQD